MRRMERGQIFLIAAVMVCVILFVIASYTVQLLSIGKESARLQSSDEIFLFTNIYELSWDVVRGSIWNDPSGASLESDLAEFRDLVRKWCSERGYTGDINYRYTVSRSGRITLANVRFNLTLASEKMFLRRSYLVSTSVSR